METAPLTTAYDHARDAALYTYKGSLNAARESHQQAAGDFATAGKSTHDIEALRILRLLEDHHQHLAAVISSTNLPRHTSASTSAKAPQTPDTTADGTAEETKVSSREPEQINPSSRPSAVNPVLRRPPRRDLTSSIASNLATARGRPNTQRRALPITPELTTQHAGGKISSRASERATTSELPKPPRGINSVLSTVDRPQPASEGFNTFFTSFETLFSKLSAPLAFAGLPLTIEQASLQPEPASQGNNDSGSKASQNSAEHKRSRSRATADPDLTNLFSAPALRAIREDAGPAFGAHESFYVVPPSGGTLSYAGIVSGRGDAGDNIDDDGDEFVDARESVGPPSPRSSRGSGSLSRLKKGYTAAVQRSKQQVKSESGKTMEELELENNALRQLLDTQSRRLQMWEASSQSQSLALAQSLRFSRPKDAVAALASPKGANSSADAESERVKELEDMLIAVKAQQETLEHRNDKLERENEKLLSALGKYRAKWAKLTENARQREKNKAAAAAGIDDRAGSSK